MRVSIAEEDLPQLQKLAAICIVVLNGYDALLTRHLLANGGHEGNPLMAPLVGSWLFWLVKLSIPLLLVFFHFRAPRTRKRVLLLTTIAVFYFMVVTSNYWMMIHRYA